MPANQKKQTRDADATKAALIRAGEALFASRGFAGTTMDMIAAEAKANKALVSYYFGSKEGLFHAVIASLVDDVVHDVKEHMTGDDDPIQNFCAYIESLSQAIGSRPAFSAILLRGYVDGSMQGSESPFRKVLEFFGMTLAHYEAGYKAKLFRKLDPHLLHLSIVGPVSHFVVAAAARRKNVRLLKGKLSDPDLQAFIAHHQMMILSGLRRNDP
ncbi:TetR/AcrR family transcriptional regulator [Hyphococcus sp.]|uniref:TetR/AcrR family transcriptional regulator n=1 Tax=Hyphococcus sp. TaxID=2038636 RepID=UPI00208316E5|nr:MAG: transcriptional regulator [Marinicaulis sp.]